MPGDEEEQRLRITLHVVASLDGYIARKDNTVSWLESNGSVYEAGVSITAEEIAVAIKSIDCYILGSHTYEHALELGWPYGDTPVVVLTSRNFPQMRPCVKFCSGDLNAFVKEELALHYKNVWLVGGATLAQRFLALNLVDEIKLTVAPVLLGGGLRLFGDLPFEKQMTLTNTRAYRNGFVELTYDTRIRT